MSNSAIEDQGNQFLERAFSLSTVPAARDLYDEWAASYEPWLEVEKYASPARTTEALLPHLPSATQTPGPLEILDAGCGTGLAGVPLADALQRLGRKYAIDGVDLSPGMLAVAREKDIYRKLEAADLSKPLDIADGTYDILVCVGTLTKGHVGPRVFEEFVRTIKVGGVIVATVHTNVWASGGYKEEVESLAKQGLVEVISIDEFGILEGDAKGGWMSILKKK